jgi:lysophospholipase L1-like esterase
MERISCPATIAYDWGALTYYRDDDARLAQMAPTSTPRVVFIGDSITYGWPGLRPSGNFKNIDVVNRGITSQLTAQMLLRFRQDVVGIHPQVVVILGGSNDLAFLMPPAVPMIEGNLASMAQLARANGIRTILASIPPVSDYERDVDNQPAVRTQTHPPQQIREINDWMKEFAKEHDCLYLDYYSSLVDESGFFRKGYSLDGLHPNNKGYAIMEKLVNEAITAATR